MYCSRMANLMNTISLALAQPLWASIASHYNDINLHYKSALLLPLPLPQSQQWTLRFDEKFRPTSPGPCGVKAVSQMRTASVYSMQDILAGMPSDA